MNEVSYGLSAETGSLSEAPPQSEARHYLQTVIPTGLHDLCPSRAFDPCRAERILAKREEINCRIGNLSGVFVTAFQETPDWVDLLERLPSDSPRSFSEYGVVV